MANCTYCGSIYGSNRDHIIPTSYYDNSRCYNTGETVPCCKECNASLSDKMYITIQERALYLYDRYNEKYKKLLECPDWTDFELEGMGPKLTRSIRTTMRKKITVKERLRNLISVACCRR